MGCRLWWVSITLHHLFMTLSPPVKHNLTTDRGHFKDAKRSLASGCSRCTHIITFSFLRWLCKKTALKTLQVGKPSILFLRESLLFFHHWKHGAEWQCTDSHAGSRGTPAAGRAAAIWAVTWLEFSVCDNVGHKACVHTWPLMRCREKWPLCPRVFISEQVKVMIKVEASYYWRWKARDNMCVHILGRNW